MNMNGATTDRQRSTLESESGFSESRPRTEDGCPPGCICRQPWFEPDPSDPDAITVELGKPADLARMFRRPARCIHCRADIGCGSLTRFGWTKMAGSQVAIWLAHARCGRQAPTQDELIRSGAIRDPHRVKVLRRPSRASAQGSASATTVAAMINRLAEQTGLGVSIHAAIAGAMHTEYHPWLLSGRRRCGCCPSPLGDMDGQGWLQAAVIPPGLVAELGRTGVAYDDQVPAGRMLKGSEADRSAVAFFAVCSAHAWNPSRFERVLAAILGRGDRAGIVLTQLLRRVTGDDVPELGPRPARRAG
jgi:hypothetical protein